MNKSKEVSKDVEIIAMSQEPIYIGTGGFTIGRVDNTIIRDPITNIPKLPGTSLAGTWRYYMALTVHSYFKEKYKMNRSIREDAFKENGIEELFVGHGNSWVKEFEGNRYAAIKCAGQDDKSNLSVDESRILAVSEDAGHCGSCIVCKTFGFSKGDRSQRGMAYFSDLNILFFPVYTRLGTRWITSLDILNSIDIEFEQNLEFEDYEVIVCSDKYNKQSSINLGWLNFKIVRDNKQTNNLINELEKKFGGKLDSKMLREKIIIVSGNIIHQIINSNLETRTSVSIDPLTGTAKKGALFTSEAIPRGTIFHGDVRIEEHPLEKQLTVDQISRGLKDSKKHFETLGIGGMTTRGFGRLKIFDWGEANGKS